MKGDERFFCVLCVAALAAFALFAACERKPDGPLTDVDGNQYSSVKIGNQVWMSQDLRVTHFPDGSALSTYDILIDKPAYVTLSGKVYYNAAAAQNGTFETGTTTQGICPDGWHLPAEHDWNILKKYIVKQGYKDIGPALRSKNADAWPGENDATDVFGFSLVAGHFLSYPRSNKQLITGHFPALFSADPHGFHDCSTEPLFFQCFYGFNRCPAG